jgi:hypothetical protein
MKAIVRETYGPPDVLHLEEVPMPTLGDGDVLVRVHAASANAGDWHLLRGTPFPFRLVDGVRTPSSRSSARPNIVPREPHDLVAGRAREKRRPEGRLLSKQSTGMPKRVSGWATRGALASTGPALWRRAPGQNPTDG